MRAADAITKFLDCKHEHDPLSFALCLTNLAGTGLNRVSIHRLKTCLQRSE